MHFFEAPIFILPAEASFLAQFESSIPHEARSFPSFQFLLATK